MVLYSFNIISCSLVRLLQKVGLITTLPWGNSKHFRGEIGRAISNLVAVLVSDLWALVGKNGTVFFNNWPPS